MADLTDKDRDFETDNDQARLLGDEKSDVAEDPDVPTTWPEAKTTLYRIFEVALPTCLTYTLSNVLYITNLSFMGGLGAVPLAGATLGSTVFNVVALSASYGLLSAMDTLGAHAFGAKAYTGVGIVLQRAILVSTVACCLLAPLLLFAKPVLMALGQDHEVATLAAGYIRFLLIGLWPLLMFECLRRYLQAQGVTIPALFCSGVIAASNWAGQAIAVKVLHGGVQASAFATSCAQIAGALSMFGYVLYRNYAGIGEKTWGGWTLEAFHGIKPFITLAIPSLLLTCSEWWVWETIVFLAGVISPVNLAASGIYLQTANVLFMLPLGLGAGMNVAVGHDLGAGAWRRAARCAWIGILCTWVLAVFLALLLFVTRSAVAAFFTADPDVRKLAGKLLLLLSAGVLADANQAACGGLIRAAALQSYGAVANLFAYYVVGMPLAAGLAFGAKWQALGLWFGIVTGEIVVAGLFLFRLLRLDWRERAEYARSMLHHKAEGEEEENGEQLMEKEKAENML